jgi:hypothetical protein
LNLRLGEASPSIWTGSGPQSQLKPKILASGEDGLSFKDGLPPLDIFVGDLLLSRSNRFRGELVEHAEDFCGYAVRRPCKRSQALSREHRRSLQRGGFGGSRSRGSETRRRPSTAATPFDPAVSKAEYRRLWPRGRRRCQGRPKTPSTRYSSDEKLENDPLFTRAAGEQVMDFVDNDDADFQLLQYQQRANLHFD